MQSFQNSTRSASNSSLVLAAGMFSSGIVDCNTLINMPYGTIISVSKKNVVHQELLIKEQLQCKSRAVSRHSSGAENLWPDPLVTKNKFNLFNKSISVLIGLMIRASLRSVKFEVALKFLLTLFSYRPSCKS